MKTVRVQAHIAQPTGTNHNILIATTHCVTTNATIILDDMDYEPVHVETDSPNKAPEYNDDS